MFEDGLTLFISLAFSRSQFFPDRYRLASLVLCCLFGLIKGPGRARYCGTLAAGHPSYGRSLAADERTGLAVGTGAFDSAYSVGNSFSTRTAALAIGFGAESISRWFYKVEPSRVIDEVVNGVVQVAEQGYGALIVLGRQSPLGSVVETGVAIDSEVSDDLLTTIFNPRTPLHDQAVVIQGERLIAARCTLPLAEEVEDQRLGTRHRAALGLAQESDAVTIVVSEETRTISLAIGGVLLRGLNRAELKQRLAELLAPQQTDMVAATRSPEEDEV